MSRSPVVAGPGRLGRRAAAVLATAVLPVGLAGCGAGFNAQTYQERTVADGTNAAAGAVAIRNISVQAPPEESGYEAGDDAPVTFTLANDGTEDDRLVEVSSPVAASIDIVSGDDTVDEVPLPGLRSTTDEVSLVLNGLERDLRPSEYVELTLRFERGGSVTVATPVATLRFREPREVSENIEDDSDQEGVAGLEPEDEPASE